MKRNEWATRFGPKRRALDHAILAEAERAIAGETAGTRLDQETVNALAAAVRQRGPREVESPSSAIAKAFGRPVQNAWRPRS
jgi:hypothetical protein